MVVLMEERTPTDEAYQLRGRRKKSRPVNIGGSTIPGFMSQVCTDYLFTGK